MQTHCQAVVVAAPSSGSGKTSIVAGLAYLLRRQGKRVRVFKTGPDFIDPQFLSYASGAPVYQLDFWMCGIAHCKHLIAQAAQEADIILIEGVMGMFDGKSSSADIAAQLGIPVLLVVDAGKMAQTFGAIVQGLASYRDDIEITGVIANRVGSDSHAQMLAESLRTDIPLLGYLSKSEAFALPERHLGLVQVCELDNIEQRLALIANDLQQNLSIELPEIAFSLEERIQPQRLLHGKRIAIARDAAFSFIYQANLDLLEEMGAELCFFSPLNDKQLPRCDVLYLPGGYPELYAQELSRLDRLRDEIHAHFYADKPILAECGGMLFLNRSLTDINSNREAMMGVLQADSYMQGHLAELGLIQANLGTMDREDTLRGHCFHYSTTESQEEVFATPVTQRGRSLSPIYKKRGCIASYAHIYFASNPQLVADIFLGRLTR